MAISDVVEEIEGDLTVSEDYVGQNPGPLTGTALTEVTNRLEDVQDNIDLVLEEFNNVGNADTSNLPATLPANADECVRLAAQANIEIQKPNPDAVYICNRMKTINFFIDAANGYRDRAGIS